MRTVVVIFSLSIMLGCSSANKPTPGDPRYAPVMPPTPAASSKAAGSIYASGAGISLWEDKRARRVGDIITVYLDEKTISSKSNKTDISKEDTLKMDVGSVMGVEPSFHVPGFPGKRFTLDSDAKNAREFAGDAGSDQSNRLVGQISVTVAEVLPNGVMSVRGEKWMTLSQGDEFIRLEGLLRPSDIAPDNTVISSRMADARITYSATGALAEAQEQGWMSRVFSSRWWPF